MGEVMTTLLEGMSGDHQHRQTAEQLATLPMRMGGLGLRSAVRTAPAACWASWGDTLLLILDRLPGIAHCGFNLFVF